MWMRRAAMRMATVVAALLLVLSAACAPTPKEITPEEATPLAPEAVPAAEWGIIEIRVTDPPPADVKSAVVYLTGIEVHRVSDNVSEWVVISDSILSFDLLDVIGIAKVLASANVTAGSFTQIRMEVTEVTGLTTDDVQYTAEVPSGKLRIVRPFNVEPGVKTILTLDFDGEKSLIVTGSGKFLFKPVVKLLLDYEEERKVDEDKVEEEEEERETEAEEEVEEEEAEVEEVEIEGTIENMPADAPWIGQWVIDSQTVIVNADTVIEGTPEIGLVAKVEALVQPDGSLLAVKIEVEEEEEEDEEEEE